MLLTSAHEAFNSDHRRFHDTQLPVARQEGPAPQQKGHGPRHIDHSTVNNRYLVAGGTRVKPFNVQFMVGR